MKKILGAAMLTGAVAAAALAWASDAPGNGPKLITNIPMTSTKPFGFDISAASDGNYYLANGSNATLDVIDSKTMTVRDRISADFAGIGPTNDKWGPSGVFP